MKTKNEETVWYQVIGSLIIPVDVLDITTKTLIIRQANEEKRVLKSTEYSEYFDNLEDAKREARRNLEDEVRRCEAMLNFYKEKLALASEQLAIMNCV